MNGAGDALARPRLLLTGDVSARPEGLERALTRAGFQLGETPHGPHDVPPDALLTTLTTAEPDALRRLLADAAAEPPRVIIFSAPDPDAPAVALGLGAADALAAPVHLPDLCARIVARIRERQAPFRTPYESRVRDSLRDLVEEARSLLQPEEVALALVRRLVRALELAEVSFVLTRAGPDEGRVLARTTSGEAEPARLDLARHPAISEAVRSRRTVIAPEPAGATPAAGPTTILPVTADGEVRGVLLLRPGASGLPLGATQLGVAASLAEAAARAFETGRDREDLPTFTPTLDRRLQEEFERARRYSLSFSLVLLGFDGSPEPEAPDAGALARQRHEVSARIRRELRLPDFVSNYGEHEFAVVLPETGAEGARRSVVRLRERVAGVSAGIVAYPHPAVAAPDDMFALVEAALRRGRAQSGERIGVAE
ncbi:MAG: hypothetical protein ACTHM9_08215 [Gemmatimonadales bacterium]